MLISDAPFAAYQYQHLNRPRSIQNSAVQTLLLTVHRLSFFWPDQTATQKLYMSHGANFSWPYVGQNSAKSGIAKQRRIWGLGVSTD